MRRALVWKKSAGAGFRGGLVTAEKLGDYSWSGDAALAAKMFGSMHDLTPESKSKLESYVNYAWVL